MTEAEKEEAEHLAVIEDEKIVDHELQRYEADGIINDNHPGSNDFDILYYWQVRLFIYVFLLSIIDFSLQSKQTMYLLLWKIVLNILPAQASAVPCEHIFSSSKGTNTLHLSNLSPIIMEILQILKFIFQNNHLSFIENLVSMEEELSVIDISVVVLPHFLADFSYCGK
jgi:hypothetical protein